jgi:hypothetical protein
MKKFLIGLIVLCAAQGILNAKPDTSRIEEAIEKLEVAQVELLLRKLDREEMLLTERRLVYRKLLDRATDGVERQQRIKGEDLTLNLTRVGELAMGLGLYIALFGLYNFETGDPYEWTRKQRINDVWFKKITGFGVLLSAAGGFILYTSDTRTRGLAQAQAIELSIENRIAALGDSQKKSSE